MATTLPLATQTLYAELLELLCGSDGHREFSSLAGSFIQKRVKVKGQELRVDLLTPGSGKPVYIPRFKTAAATMPFLDFILEDTLPAVVVNGGATLVRIPSPGRFGLHKLAVADQRPASEQPKAAKDRAQAVEVLSWVLTERPGDLELVLEELATKRRKAWTIRIARSARRTQALPAELLERLDETAEKASQGK